MDRVEFRTLRHDEDGRMWHEGQLFAGVGVDFWPNGQLASELHYVDGIQDGWTRGWHANGALSTETFYAKGRATGIVKKWHPNGQLKLEKEIEQGIRVWSKEWDETGRLVNDYVLKEGDPLYEDLLLRRQEETEAQAREAE